MKARNKAVSVQKRRSPHALNRSFRLFLFLVIFILTSAAYLSYFGLPSPVKKSVIRTLETKGIFVDMARIRWDILNGIVADDVRYYDHKDALIPLIRIDEVMLALSPLDWLKRRHGVRSLRVESAVIHSVSKTTVDSAAVDRGILMSEINARVTVEPRGVRIDDFHADYRGMKISGGGYLARPRENIQGSLVKAWLNLFPSQTDKEGASWVSALMVELEDTDFLKGSSADFEFSLHPEDLNANECRLDIRGGETRIRGLSVSQWTLQAELQDGRITVPRFVVHQKEKSLRLSGYLDLHEGIASGKVFSDLPPFNWLSLIPVDTRFALETSGTFIGGDLELAADIGPAPIQELKNVFKGSMVLKQADLMGVWIDHVSLDFGCEEGVMIVTNLLADVGRDNQRGPLDGDFRYSVDSKSYEGRVRSGFDPNALLPVMNYNRTRIISALKFMDHMPQAAVSFSGKRGHPEVFRMEGDFVGTNFVFRGSYVTLFESHVVLTNGVFTLFPLNVERDDTSCRGRVSLNFPAGLVDVDVESTFDPKATARIIGPFAEKLFRSFEFRGYSYIKAKGYIDYEARENMNLEASVITSNMTYRNVMTERCTFTFLAYSNRFDMKNIEGQLYTGDFQADAALYPLNEPSLPHYEMTVVVNHTDFGELMQAYKQMGDDHPYEGWFDFNLGVSGELDDDWKMRMQGRGDIHIYDSRLLRIPLFGGLSKILTILYPGLGFISKNDLRAGFKIGGNNIRTKDARLLGHIISVDAAGRYIFDNNLDFKVRVKLLREGPLAAILNILTFPVTKLLEFHLNGPLEEPEWRPQNLPKELFQLFKTVVPGGKE